MSQMSMTMTLKDTIIIRASLMIYGWNAPAKKVAVA